VGMHDINVRNSSTAISLVAHFFSLHGQSD
jgi:hypothetical protein